MATVPPLLFDDGTAVLFDDDTSPVEQFFSSPRALHPVAWYDADLGGSASQIVDSSGNGVAALTFGAGSNSPTWLDATVPMLYLPYPQRNTTGNSTAFNVTDIDTWTDCALESYTPSSIAYFSERVGTAPNLQYRFSLNTTGRAVFVWYPTGSTPSVTHTTTDTIATVAGVSAGERVAVRATLDVDNGAGAYTLTVYHRLGGADGTWDTWETFTGASTTSLPTVNRVLEVGATGSTYADMKLFGFEFRDSIGGTPVAEIKPARAGQASYTDAYGRSWTGYGSRQTSGRKPVALGAAANATRDTVLVGVDDYADGPTAALPSATAGTSATMAAVVRVWATQAAGNVIWTTRASAGAKGIRLEMAGTGSIRAKLHDGTSEVTTPSVAVRLGPRQIVGVILDGSNARVFAADSAGVTLGSVVARTGNDETGGDLRCFNDQALAAGSDLDGESECPWMSFDTALTEDDLLDLLRYYDGGILDGLDPVTGNLTGTLTVPGSIASTLDPATGDLAGLVGAIGALASTLADTTGDIAGLVGVIGALASTLDPATGDLAGLVGVIGQLDAALADTTGDLAGLVGVIGQLDAALADIAASVEGTVYFDGALGATLGPVTSSIDDLLVGINRLRAAFRERTRATYREV